MDNETLSRRMDAFEEQLAKNTAVCEPLAEEIKVILRTVTDINAEIGIAPAHELRAGRPSIRQRIHKIEADTSSVAIEAAVNRAISHHSDRLWSAWQKRVTVFGVLAGAFVGILRIFGIGG